mgnify:CR=1 FL=1
MRGHAARAGAMLLALAACASTEPPAEPPPAIRPELAAMYGAMEDNGHHIPAVDPNLLTGDKTRQMMDYWTDEKPGTIIVDPHARYLYQVRPGNKAMRYAVAVGAAGYGFTGEAHIPYQRDWPSWKPTDNMVATQPELYGPLKGGLRGGVDNPLGSRALYLYKGGRDTMYRIHGTMDPSSIGKATSAGCIRLFNQDIMDLFDEIPSGTAVKVRTRAESLALEGPLVELPNGYLAPAGEVQTAEAQAAQ